MAGWDQAVPSTVPLDLNANADAALNEAKITPNQLQIAFRRFLWSHTQSGADTYPYRSLLKAQYEQQQYHFRLRLEDLRAFSSQSSDAVERQLSDLMVQRPDMCVEAAQDAAKDVVAMVVLPAPNRRLMPTIQCELTGHNKQTDFRHLTADEVGQLVQVNGMVINASKPRIKASQLQIVCKSCRTVKTITPGPGFGSARLPRICDGRTGEAKAGNPQGEKCPFDPYQILPDSSQYVDQQRLKLQEVPEAVPTGEMPRSLNLSADGYLTSRVKPGQRVTMIGVYTTFNAKTGSSSGRGANAAGNTAREVGIRQTYVRVLGIAIDQGDSREQQQFSPKEEEEIQKIARDPNPYERIARSIGPAIFGSEDIKKAIACQLFGGTRKRLPDGMRLRGDINVLLLGDPSVAKSQFLKFAYTVAPIGVYTSGKGASAAGLTASVLRDPSTGEFHLEGGAMVLGDGGLVCIDEFDKMREQDRVAIHEAMEQQTISIAKAGITTILNSRTSVLAAANPVFGRYDDMKSPTENIDFQTTILSRFDIIFIIRDVQDRARDMALVDYIIRVHKDGKQALQDQKHGEGLIEAAALKRYIQYARQKVRRTRLSEEGAKVLQSHYVQIRTEHGERRKEAARDGRPPDSVVPITVRQLEAIVRISEALARLELKDEANATHVTEAIRLFKVSTFAAATTQYGDGTAVSGSAQFMESVQSMERIVRRRLPISTKVQRQRLVRDLTGDDAAFQAAANKAIDIMILRQELRTYGQGKMLERIR